jgi:hypothetical protein
LRARKRSKANENNILGLFHLSTLWTLWWPPPALLLHQVHPQ